MSTFAIILIVVGVVVLLLFAGGLSYAARRYREQEPEFLTDVAAADRALEEARAQDRGWERATMESAARQALQAERPDFPVEELHLVLVDDRPGVTEDRAEFMAVGDGRKVLVGLVRDESGWKHDRVE
jgi:hypothetical protein